ncbi:MAG: methyltransferase domain-containing protein [Bdellovibrionales bacterium]|nr:methyltransferase domain-containing protein [Bdellovibrionales bacterium]
MRFTIFILSALVLVIGCSHAGHKDSKQHRHHHAHHRAHHKHHHHDFSDAEKYAKRFNDTAREKWQNPNGIIEVMGVKPGETVAEIGAGTGYMLPFLSKAVGENGKVYAIDVEQPLIDYMNKYSDQKGLKNVETKKVPYDNPMVSGLGLSRVLFLVTWHHLEKKQKYVRELSKQLASGSTVTVVEPDYTMTGRPAMTPPKHFHVAPEEVRLAFEQGAFDCVVADEQLKFDVAVVCTRK